MRSAMVGAALALCAVALSGCTADGSALETPAPTASAVPSATASPDPDDPTAVVTIAAADVDGTTVTVAGFVTQVSEEGGECEFDLTFVVDSTTVTVPSSSAANVTTTSCGTVQVPVSSLAKGTWSVVLTYSSKDWDLTSAPVTMEVP